MRELNYEVRICEYNIFDNISAENNCILNHSKQILIDEDEFKEKPLISILLDKLADYNSMFIKSVIANNKYNQVQIEPEEWNNWNNLSYRPVYVANNQRVEYTVTAIKEDESFYKFIIYNLSTEETV